MSRVRKAKIVDCLRNVPQRFERPADDALAALQPSDFVKMIRDRVSKGIDPSYVGELVREGIENDWPYIFTDSEFEPFIEARLPRSSRASTGFVDGNRGIERKTIRRCYPACLTMTRA